MLFRSVSQSRYENEKHSYLDTGPITARNVTVYDGKVEGIRSTETVCNVTLMNVTVVRDTVGDVIGMDEIVYREDISIQ